MLSKRSLLWIGFLFCLLALVPSALFSQSASTGTVAGTVTDPSGAAVADATVTLTDKATNNPRVASTNENGRFILVDVPAGTYDFTVSKQGFRISKLTGQTVSVGSALTLNVDSRSWFGCGERRSDGIQRRTPDSECHGGQHYLGNRPRLTAEH